MTRNWKITEKAIGGLLMVWGGFALVVTISVIKQLLDFGFEHLDYTWEDISIIKLIKSYHYQVLLLLITIFAGLTLILNKKIGWLTCVLTSTLHGISMILLPWTIEMKNETQIYFYIFTGITALIFITILGLLLTKQIRSKYNPTKKTLLIMILLFVLLLVDKLFIK